jgi:TetR/AcrR family transcriptional repressor of nem operon
MKADIKNRILQVGARLVHRKGFHATGVAEVVKAAGVPKGSFYFYFDSKEAFGLELVDAYAQMIADVARTHLLDEREGTPERIRSFFEYFVGILQKNDFRDGCPIGNLCQEMGDTSEPFRKKLENVMESLQQDLAEVIAQGQERGQVLAEVDPESIAGFLLSGWQGALLQMKVKKTREPYEAFSTLVFDHMLKPKPGRARH